MFNLCSNMKNFWILTIFLSLGLLKTTHVLSQSDTLQVYQCYNSFSNEAKAEWTAFQNSWYYFDFTMIKKKYKIKGLNCKNCESLFADIYIEINNEGNVSISHFLKGKKCGIPCNEKEFINLFEQSIKKNNFKSLKNKQFIARFGNSLKC